MKKESKSSADRIQQILTDSQGSFISGADDQLAFQRISTGIASFDELTGGGIPKKRLTIISGDSSVGKSYLASQIAKRVQGDKGLVAWIDTEMAWDRDWMLKCGLDTKNVMLCQNNIGEEVFDQVSKLMKEGIDIIILDSLAGLIPTSMQDENFAYNPVAWQARMINQSLPRLFPLFHYGSALLFINQMRATLGPMSSGEMPGGKAQKFFAHFILELRRRGWIVEKEEKVGFDIEIICRKSKVGGRVTRSCIIPFRMDGGIDPIEIYLREAIGKGIIKRARAWFVTPEGEKAMGMNGLRQHYLENPSLLKGIIKDLEA